MKNKKAFERIKEHYPELMSDNICKFSSIGEGWYELVEDLCSRLSPDCKVLQVKEKFGGLRFYAEGTSEDHELIHAAEAESTKICETCGEPGRLRNFAWRSTLCDAHAEGRHETL